MRPILTYSLSNGLNLQCLDRSKKIASDRWFICVLVQVDIPVEKQWFDRVPVEEDQFQQIRRVLGKTVRFEQKKERNFVSEENKARSIKDILDSVVETTAKYFAHEDFAARYILKRFSEHRRAY